MSPTEEDVRLLARTDEWDGPEPTVANVGSLVLKQGLDFATALIFRQLSRRQANAEYLHEARTKRFRPPNDLVLGIVPGAFYREHGHTGADGARVLSIARELGIAAELIPTAGFGTLADNARILLQWIAARRGARVALVSLSKGGADVKHALSLPGAGEAFADVDAWVSLSGMMLGTPLIAWLRRQPMRWRVIRFLLWLRGHSRDTLDDLRHGPGAPLGRWPSLPLHMRVVHVCGFPLERHLVHRWAPRAYARLAPLGPNDGGGNLLADILDYPGIVCPVWGADHYLAPRWDAVPLLTQIIASALAPRQASQSAPHPSAPPASRSSA